MRANSVYADAQSEASAIVREAIDKLKDAQKIVTRVYEDVSKHNPEDSNRMYNHVFKLVNQMEQEKGKLKDISQTIYNLEFED